MYRLYADILQAEHQSLPSEEIVAIIQPAREVQGMCPFIRRLQEWPRGYPGDFETIEYLCAGHNHAVPDSVTYYLEEVALFSPPAQQHRNKIAQQTALIRETLASCSRHAFFLSHAVEDWMFPPCLRI